MGAVCTAAEKGVVEAFCVFPKDGHVDHSGLPNLTEASVDLVRYPFVEFDRTNIGIPIQAAAQTKDD